MGPYAHKGNQWVSYDDKAMVHQKAQLIRRLGLGGGMIWALDLDDFKDHCNEGVHPLLTELQSVLAGPLNESDQQSEQNQDIDAEIIEEELSHEDSAEISSSDIDYKVVCYFTNWAWYVLDN